NGHQWNPSQFSWIWTQKSERCITEPCSLQGSMPMPAEISLLIKSFQFSELNRHSKSIITTTMPGRKPMAKKNISSSVKEQHLQPPVNSVLWVEAWVIFPSYSDRKSTRLNSSH